MKLIKYLILKFLLWATPAPANFGWCLACAGDFILEKSGRIGMEALRGLSELESEAV